MQKVHLRMDCGKRILWSWTQSIVTKIRAATVQSSVWTLQQISPDRLYCYSIYSNFSQITQRAISLQKVHLWMGCSKRVLWSWTQSIATKIRAATVQSSVWTLQQILPDREYYFLYTSPDLCTTILFKNFTISLCRGNYFSQIILTRYTGYPIKKAEFY